MLINDIADAITAKQIREAAKKKGADGKACWDGYRYNGTENGKDKCVKVRTKEDLNEFAPGDGNDGEEEETLHKYARMWYNGDYDTQQKVEQVLARMGWEIGEVEDEEGGVFVVQQGDINGNSYLHFPVDDLSEGVADGQRWPDEKTSLSYLDRERVEVDPKANKHFGPLATRLDGPKYNIPQKPVNKSKLPGEVPNFLKKGVAESQDRELDQIVNEMFDQIEHMVETIAQHYGVDSEIIWEHLEDIDDQDLLMETAAWQKSSGKNKNGGLNRKGVASYRASHPGSHLQTAVTTKPSKLKKGSKASKRRKSFCARMKGMKKHRAGAKTKRDPNSRINKALRKWHC